MTPRTPLAVNFETALHAPLSEILTVDDVARRLSLSTKALRELADCAGFPLWRLTPRGTLYAYEREVAEWVRKNRTPIGQGCQGK